MPEKNEHAAALGRLGRGKAKRYNADELARRQERARQMTINRVAKQKLAKAGV